MERIIFHVDMNAFFASVEQAFNPALRNKPIAVCGNPEKRTVVAACSYPAKACGIQNGMSIGQARWLCPDLILVSGDPEKYMAISQGILTLLNQWSPQVEIFSIDEAFLDLTHVHHFCGDTPEDTARQIKTQIHQRHQITCSVGIGSNKLMAKLASGLQKPDGLVRLRPTDLPGLLKQLPIQNLCGIGDKLQHHLNQLGIVTCNDLGNTPENLLVERFGVIGHHLKKMGQGIDETEVAPSATDAPAKSMGHCYTLAKDTSNRQAIASTLLRLSEQVARRLRNDGCLGRTIVLSIRYADFSGLTRHRTTCYSTDNGLQIQRTALRLFRKHCEPLTQRVRMIGVSVSNLTRDERQSSFLKEECCLEQIDCCLDQINDRYGEFTVTRANAIAPLVTKSHGFLHAKPNQQRWLLR